VAFGGIKWFGNKPMLTPADVKGLPVRSSADVISRVIEQMGGTPVFIEAKEVYSALQRGMIDANMISASSIIDRRCCDTDVVHGVGIATELIDCRVHLQGPAAS